MRQREKRQKRKQKGRIFSKLGKMPAEREMERKDKGKEGKMQNEKEEDNDKTEEGKEGKTEAGKPNLLRKTKKRFRLFLLYLWLCQVRVNKLLLV